MVTRFDEKGKIFTNVVKKDGMRVVIQTGQHRIEGQVYVRPDERLIDEMNRGEQFLPVTQATIFDMAGNEVLKCSFLTVNRNHIMWMVPEEEIQVG